MLGGLYGDLPPPSSTTDEDSHNKNPNPSSNVWSSTVKMAPPTLRKPSSSYLTPPPPKPQIKPQQTKPRIITPPSVVASSFQPALVGVTSSVLEEYDPARPNDYQEYKRERIKKAAEAELKAEIDRRRKEDEEREKKDNKNRETDFNISGEEAWNRRAAMAHGPASRRSPSSPPSAAGGGGGDGFCIEKSETEGLGVGAGGHLTAAQRMMAKMGWKAGQGLGKLEQGITTPLMAKKTDKRAGIIVNASEQKQHLPVEKKSKGVSINGQPTRVVLLRNMVNIFPYEFVLATYLDVYLEVLSI